MTVVIAQWRLNTALKQGAIHDADSFHVLGYLSFSNKVDLPGYEQTAITTTYFVQEMTRVIHCNAPELRLPEGITARDKVRQWFTDNINSENVPLVTYGRDKYRRLLVDVIPDVGQSLSQVILSLPGSVRMSLREQMWVPPT